MEAIYRVNFVRGFENVTVFEYDRVSKAFTPTALAAGRAAISSDEGVNTFTVDGVAAMTVTDAGLVSVDKLTQRINPQDSPRLEFLRITNSVPERIGYISKAGTLWIPNITEDEVPAGTDQLHLSLAAAFTPNGLVCDSIEEVP